MNRGAAGECPQWRHGTTRRTPHGHISISRIERRPIVSLVAKAPSAVAATTVGLGALFHLCRDHAALNFGEDLLAFLEAQAKGRERDFLGPLPGGDIDFDMFAGAISAITFSFQFKG